MAVISSLLHLTLLLSLVLGGDGYYQYNSADCIFSSDLKDVELLYTVYFNRVPFTVFNSTVGKFVGLTQYGVSNAEYWNNDTQILEGWRTVLDRYCKPNTENDYNYFLSKTVEPKVVLRSEQKASGQHPALLMCSAYNFYPPAISVSWLRNGKKVDTGVISTEELDDGDWYYQVHSRLEYNPKSGDKISCVVEHASFKTPMIYDWDPSLPESERNKVAIGTSGLVLGIVLSAAGLIYYYKKRTAGRILVPS